MRIRLHNDRSGFTMVEIALCLAIVGFALVAIIGVLPAGMNVQRDNRDETVVNQDAAVWMDAIRNGAQGYNDLTNFVTSIAVTNFNGNAVNSWTIYNRADLAYGGAARIIQLLSLPKYPNGNADQTNRNYIVAVVRAMSGAAVEKPPQANPDLENMAFSYRLVVENTEIPMDLTATNAVTGVMNRNARELRLLFRWPVLPRGIGNGRQVYRTLIGGQAVSYSEGPVFQPSTYR